MKKIISILLVAFALSSSAQSTLSLSRIQAILANGKIPIGANNSAIWYTLYNRINAFTGANGYIPLFYNGSLVQSFVHQESNTLFIRDGKYFGDSSNISRMRFAPTGLIFDRSPVKYGANYGARFTDSTLVDKQYVDSSFAVASPAYPHVYKALISQNAPVANTKTPSLLLGQIWELTYTAGAGTQLSYLELVSGTLDSVGSKYRMSKDTALTLDSGDSLKYDGSPYVVSTNAAGAFSPFVNTLGGNPVYSYDSAGAFSFTLATVFSLGKTISKLTPQYNNGYQNSNFTNILDDAPNVIYLSTLINGVPTNGILQYSIFEAEVYQ